MRPQWVFLTVLLSFGEREVEWEGLSIVKRENFGKRWRPRRRDWLGIRRLPLAVRLAERGFR